MVILFIYYISMVHTIEAFDPMGKPVALQGVEDIVGKNMCLLSPEEISRIVLASNPRIKDVRIEKVFPQTIKLQVALTFPVAFYKVADDTYILVSQDGVVTGLTYELPDLQGEIVYYQQIVYGEYELGKQIPYQDFRYAASLAYETARITGQPFQIAVLDPDQIDITMADTVIRTSYDENAQKRLVILADVLKTIRSGAQRIKFVDIRFEKLVIEKW